MYDICPLSDLFHLAYSPGSSILSQMARFHSFLWMPNIPFYTNRDTKFSVHSSTDGHLGCFHILAIVNNGRMNIMVHIFFPISVSVFFRYIPMSGIAGSYNGSMVLLVFWFFFLRNLHIVFYSGCTNLNAHQQCTRIPFSSHPCQELSVIFLIIAILTAVRWYLFVAFIFLMTSDVKQLFMCLLATSTSSLEKYLLRSSANI